jgi:hypothetical protein
MSKFIKWVCDKCDMSIELAPFIKTPPTHPCGKGNRIRNFIKDKK